MLKTKLLLLLLLIGALATEQAAKVKDVKKAVKSHVEKAVDTNDYSDCVVTPEEGGTYYIKLEGPTKSYYSYVFGDRVEADKPKGFVQLEARHSIAKVEPLVRTKEKFGIQEFTFQDNSLVAEMEPANKSQSGTEKYYVGLQRKSLYAYKNADKFRPGSRTVVIKDKRLHFGVKGSEIEPTIANATNFGSMFRFSNDYKVCLVTKETASRDYAALVADLIRKQPGKDERPWWKKMSNQPGLYEKESAWLREVMDVKMKKQLQSLEVPFSIKKTNKNKIDGHHLLSALRKQMETSESRSNKIIEEKGLTASKDKLRKKHMMKYTAYAGDDKEKRISENGKFDEAAFTRLLFPKVGKKFQKIQMEANQGENNTPSCVEPGTRKESVGGTKEEEEEDDSEEKEEEDDLEEKEDESKGAVEGVTTGTENEVKDDKGENEVKSIEDEAEDEVKAAEGDSGKKSLAVVSALAAILFFL